jgi:hypothetical protein
MAGCGQPPKKTKIKIKNITDIDTSSRAPALLLTQPKQGMKIQAVIKSALRLSFAATLSIPLRCAGLCCVT